VLVCFRPFRLREDVDCGLGDWRGKRWERDSSWDSVTTRCSAAYWLWNRAHKSGRCCCCNVATQERARIDIVSNAQVQSGRTQVASSPIRQQALQLGARREALCPARLIILLQYSFAVSTTSTPNEDRAGLFVSSSRSETRVESACGKCYSCSLDRML
jgi:hypothetical protein